MPAKGEHNLSDPTLAAQVVADYLAGDSRRKVSGRYHVGAETLLRVLQAAGVPLRSPSDQKRLGAIRQHASELRALSAARWHELYWGPERPSLTALAARFSTTEHRVHWETVRRVLLEHGITLRTSTMQLQEDGAQGRHSATILRKPKRFPDLTPEQQEAIRAKLRAALLGRRHSAEHRRRNGMAHRKRETRACRWCGRTISRKPSSFPVPPERTCCSRSCTRWHRSHLRRDPEAPRPLIVERLRALLAAERRTYERAERLGAEIGAGEPEIIEALVGLG